MFNKTIELPQRRFQTFLGVSLSEKLIEKIANTYGDIDSLDQFKLHLLHIDVIPAIYFMTPAPCLLGGCHL